jgi:hypothetical protein
MSKKSPVISTSRTLKKRNTAKIVPTISGLVVIASSVSLLTFGLQPLILILLIGAFFTGSGTFLYHYINDGRYLPPEDNQQTADSFKDLKRAVRKLSYQEDFTFESEAEELLEQCDHISQKKKEFDKLLNEKFFSTEITYQRYESGALKMLDFLNETIEEVIKLYTRLALLKDSQPQEQMLEKISHLKSAKEDTLKTWDHLFLALSQVKNKDSSDKEVQEILHSLEDLIERSKKFIN